MKFLRSKILAACALLSFAGSALGYTWPITNMTNKLMLVQLTLTAWSGIYFAIIQPGETVDFSWPLGSPRSGHCVSEIKVAPFNWDFMGFPDNIQMSYNFMKFHQRREFFSKLADNPQMQKGMLAHPLRVAPIKWLPDDTWNKYSKKMKEAAEKIIDGSAKTIEEAFKLLGYDVGIITNALSGIATGVFDLFKKSPCASRSFDIVDENGTLTLVTKIG